MPLIYFKKKKMDKVLNYYRSVFVVLLSLISINKVHAQMQQMMQKGMNAGRLYGKVMDSKTNKPVEFAAVQVSVFKKDSTGTLKENILNGQLTQGNGDFSLEQLPVMGELTFKIAAMGYKPYEQKVKFEIKIHLVFKIQKDERVDIAMISGILRDDRAKL